MTAVQSANGWSAGGLFPNYTARDTAVKCRGRISVRAEKRKEEKLGRGVHERMVKPSLGNERLYPAENVMAHESYRTSLMPTSLPHFQDH